MTTIAGPEEEPLFQQIVAQFNQTVPQTMWRFDRVPGTWEDLSSKYVAQIAAGSPNDAVRIAIIQKSSYVDRGYLSDLMPFFERDGLKFDDYLDGAFKDWQIDGKLYGIPAGIYNMALYYNKDLFDAAGLPYPPTEWDTDAWTWNEFRAAAQALTAGSGAEKQYGMGTTWDLRWVIQFVWQNNGDFVDANHSRATLSEPAALEALQFVEAMVREDQAWATPAATGSDDIDELFRGGRVGMYMDGMWQMPAMAAIEGFRWGVAPLPRGKASFTGLYVDAWVMPTGVKDPEQSWQFLKYMTTAAPQNLLVDNGALGVPILKSVAEERSGDLFKPLSPEEQQVWLNASKYSHLFPYTRRWDELYDALLPAWDLWSIGEIDAIEMAAQMTAVIDPILARE
ncbi:sugar ABC transporter substrate-binding protein [Candidatus Gracilibacteria bacterium]|nr:sugar ABC transporter substrate-binding protein [Candidatus Gracilibacteria bacterium]